MITKTLANCTLAEFLKQTNKIKKAVSQYIDTTKILDTRKNMPDIPSGATAEETQKLINEQAKKNISDMLDIALEEHTDETIEIIGLMCFMNKEEAQEIEPGEFLDLVSELISSDRVISFFTRLARLAKKTTADTLQK